jgi:hypothetical protein
MMKEGSHVINHMFEFQQYLMVFLMNIQLQTENYLFVENEPTTLEKATLYAVEERLNEPIVVLCIASVELYNLILPLRARYLQRVGLYKPIVLFSPKVPSIRVWNKLCVFPDIYFVRVSLFAFNFSLSLCVLKRND